MKKIDLNNIFSETDCIPEQILFDYQDNKLSSKERYVIEKHLANCEICSDAIEGLALIKNRNKIRKSLKYINTAIDRHSYQKKTKTISINMPTKLAIAATITILIGISFLFTHYLRNYNDKVLAENTIKTDNNQVNNYLSPVIAVDSEDTKHKTIINNNKFKVLPERNTIIVDGIVEEEKYFSIIPNTIEIPKEDLKDIKSDDSINTKSPVVFKNDLAKTTTDDNTLVYEVQVNEEKVAESQLDADKVAGGMTVKNDKKDESSGYKKEKEKNVLSISDIVSSNVKRNEGNAPSTAQNQNNSVITNEIYNQAIEKYNIKEYIVAKQMFEQILINDKFNYNAKYYKSLCLFYLEDNNNAIIEFNELLKNKNGIYYDSLKWFKALALIKNGAKKEAKKILEEIIKSNSTFKNDAEQKLKEI